LSNKDQQELSLWPSASSHESVPLRDRTLSVRYVRNPRARRYILRLATDGAVRITLPRWGSRRDAHAFALRERLWLEQQIEKRRALSNRLQPWGEGSAFLFRGESVALHINRERMSVCFGEVEFPCPNDDQSDWRPLIEWRLRELAENELPPRVFEMARVHNLKVRRVMVRSQKSRWGSCSAHGTISLNWRLIQTPPYVSDYIIIHELMHLRQMNHSVRFWKQVAEACPDYRLAEHWLKKDGCKVH